MRFRKTTEKKWDAKTTLKPVVTDYALEQKNILEKRGYKVEERELKGKKIPYFVRNIKGKIEEVPIIDREIDIYVTGYYKVRKGKQKGARVKITDIRIPLKIRYAPVKDFLDIIREHINDMATEKFEEWARGNELSAIDTWDDIEVNFDSDE